jgi:uncharacterized membrane protein
LGLVREVARGELRQSKRASRVLEVLRALALSTVTIGLLSLICLVAAALRRDVAPGYGFLRWNMFLAWIPLVLAYALTWAPRRRSAPLVVPVLTIGWILFLPNAPYLITDLVHLHGHATLPNIATLSLLALTGLLIGVKSMQIVQRVVEDRFGVAAGWRAVRVIAVLAAVGVYLGRVKRWNSWNLLSHPRGIADTLVRGVSEPSRAGTALLGCLAFAAAFYVAYRVLTQPQEANARKGHLGPRRTASSGDAAATEAFGGRRRREGRKTV